MKLTLDELHLEIQVVENLPRNPRTLFPPRREDLPRSIMGYMKFPPSPPPIWFFRAPPDNYCTVPNCTCNKNENILDKLIVA